MVIDKMDDTHAPPEDMPGAVLFVDESEPYMSSRTMAVRWVWLLTRTGATGFEITEGG